MIDQQSAQVILQFLGRVTLQPPEIEAFQKVAGQLQAIAQGAVGSASLAPHPGAGPATEVPKPAA